MAPADQDQPHDQPQPQLEPPDRAREARDLAQDLTLQLTDAPVPDSLDAATLRAALDQLGLPSAHITDTALARIRDRAPDVVQRLALDPALARRLELDPHAVARELDLPHPPGRGRGTVLTADRTRYEGRSDRATAAEILDSALLRTLDDLVFAGAWQADPVAALIVHADGTPPGVLAMAIRSLLDERGIPDGAPTVRSTANIMNDRRAEAPR